MKKSVYSGLASANNHVPETSLDNLHHEVDKDISPRPGSRESGQSIDWDDVDPLLNGEVGLGGGRHLGHQHHPHHCHHHHPRHYHRHHLDIIIIIKVVEGTLVSILVASTVFRLTVTFKEC